VPRGFEYALVTAYLPKGIRAVHINQEKITALKFIDFNLDDRKVYNMLVPHKYLTRKKEKNSKIIPQSWTINLTQSTLLNVMNIPHFGRHQEVNACVKLLLSCYHGGYLWLNRRITVDPMLMIQEHRSKPVMRQPTNISKRTFNGEERRNPLTFKFEI
jgi:hypothetical protein